jgi:arabinose-5-phosphate isomerase
MMAALGDALAVALLERRGFSATDFHALHPGGQLGQQLRRVSELMHAGDGLPLIEQGRRMHEAIIEMTAKRLGCVGIVDGAGALVGIITDGDLRRRMERGAEILDLSAGDVMSRNPIAVPPDTLAAEALNIMEQRKITAIVIADAERPGQLAGVLHIHDLWRLEMF